MRKLMLSATMMAMMVAATAVPAFAQQTGVGGNSTVSGGTVVAKNSIVAQSNNLFNVSGNVVQQRIQQNQTVNQNALALNFALLSTANQNAQVTQVAAQNAEQTGISIGNVTQSSSIAIANAK